MTIHTCTQTVKRLALKACVNECVSGVNTMHDVLKHAFEETDGDNNPFHVTNCLTTCAAGTTPIPPFLGHSSPQSKAKAPYLTSKYASRTFTPAPTLATNQLHPATRLLSGIWHIADGQRVNPTGIGVFVTKSGSMTKERFPSFCRHFVQHLPESQGKGGEPVILVFDGHSSRWSFDGLKFLLDNNVYCLCLPGHTSIWAQPNDGGPNASYKSCLADAVSDWRQTSRPLPGIESLAKMTRADFNLIFARTWVTWCEQMRQQKSGAGTNCIVTAWAGTGLHPYTREAPYWLAAIAKFGQRDELSKAPEKGVPKLDMPTVINGKIGNRSLADVFAAAAATARTLTHNPALDAAREAVAQAAAAAEEADAAHTAASNMRCEHMDDMEELHDARYTEQDVAMDTELYTQLQDAFTEKQRTAAAHAAAVAALAELQPPATSTTAGEPPATADSPPTTTTDAPAPVAADSPAAKAPVSLSTPQSTSLAPAATPATEATRTIMASAAEQSLTTARVRNFRSRLDAMEAGDCLKLQPLARDGETAAKPASLVATEGKTYLLIHCSDAGRKQELVTLDEAEDLLAARFRLPAASKAELSLGDATALRAREARQAAAEREEAKRAAVEAATLDWCALYYTILSGAPAIAVTSNRMSRPLACRAEYCTLLAIIYTPTLTSPQTGGSSKRTWRLSWASRLTTGSASSRS